MRRITLAALVLLLASVVVLVGPERADPPLDPAFDATYLPFEPPSRALLKGSSKKVFAHYMQQFQVSIDNAPPESDYYTTQFLDPLGENGDHSSYGGFLRDRPEPRPVRSDPAWRELDMQDEVRQARAAGVDGFSFNIQVLPGSPDVRKADNTVRMLDAAAAVDPDFAIMLMPDMTGAPGGLTPVQLADYIAGLASHPAAYHLSDGRLVVAPFHAESWPAEAWREFLSRMGSEHDVRVALLPVFVKAFADHFDDFRKFSYGVSSWGVRTPRDDTDPRVPPESAAAHAKGLAWMQSVSIQDVRPSEGTYWEAENTRTLHDSWAAARDADAEFVQLVTWNDYSESSHFAPSAKHGWSFLDLNAYDLAWYKTGEQPTIARDAVYVSHRTSPVAAAPTYPMTSMTPAADSSTPRDTVEALAFLTSPATVVVTVGTEAHSCTLPAGRQTCTVPLRGGAVRAEIVRDGVLTASVISPYDVVDNPYVQDLQYVISSSLRREQDRAAARVPAPTAG